MLERTMVIWKVLPRILSASLVLLQAMIWRTLLKFLARERPNCRVLSGAISTARVSIPRMVTFILDRGMGVVEVWRLA